MLIHREVVVRASGVRRDGVTPERHEGVYIIEGVNELELDVKLQDMKRRVFPGLEVEVEEHRRTESLSCVGGSPRRRARLQEVQVPAA